MSQTKQANIFRGIGRGIGRAGRGLKNKLWDFPHGDPSKMGDPRRAADAGYANEMARANMKLLGGGAAGLGGVGLGAAYAGGAFDDPEPTTGDRIGDFVDNAGEVAGSLGGRAVDTIAEGGDSIMDRLRGTFQEGGMLQGIGDWWRDLSPEAQKAIIYSAIAGGAGLGGYGLYKAFGGGGQPQPAYY